MSMAGVSGISSPSKMQALSGTPTGLPNEEALPGASAEPTQVYHRLCSKNSSRAIIVRV